MTIEVRKENTDFILVGEWQEKHYIGDEDCRECFSGPTDCKCGGLIHTAFAEEHDDGYDLYKSCDCCGSDYEE